MWKDELLKIAPIAVTAVATVVLATLTFLSIRRLGRQDEREQVTRMLGEVVSPYITQLNEQINLLHKGIYGLDVTNKRSRINSLRWRNRLLSEDFEDRYSRVSKMIALHDEHRQCLFECLKELYNTLLNDAQVANILSQVPNIRSMGTRVSCRILAEWVIDGCSMETGPPAQYFGRKDIRDSLVNLRDGKREHKEIVKYTEQLISVSEQLRRRLIKIRKRLRKRYKIP